MPRGLELNRGSFPVRPHERSRGCLDRPAVSDPAFEQPLGLHLYPPEGADFLKYLYTSGVAVYLSVRHVVNMYQDTEGGHLSVSRTCQQLQGGPARSAPLLGSPAPVCRAAGVVCLDHDDLRIQDRISMVSGLGFAIECFLGEMRPSGGEALCGRATS
mgnify:CR=1 FL=1